MRPTSIWRAGGTAGFGTSAISAAPGRISGLQARAVHSPPTASSGPRASQSAIDITMTHHKLSAAIRALRSGTVDVVV
nr:hypothetical protein [Nocardia flavorosea]